MQPVPIVETPEMTGVLIFFSFSYLILFLDHYLVVYLW